MKNILIFIIFLFIIAIIFIKLYFSYYEKFTVATEPICPEKNVLISTVEDLNKKTTNLNDLLQEAKTAAIALPENQNISSLFTTIPNKFSDVEKTANTYLNLLITDRLNRSELDKTFDNFKELITTLDNKYYDIYSNIIKYNSNPTKQTYDTAINNFKSSYDDYNTKFDYYSSCLSSIQQKERKEKEKQEAEVKAASDQAQAAREAEAREIATRTQEQQTASMIQQEYIERQQAGIEASRTL
jgi:hypothetical protein